MATNSTAATFDEAASTMRTALQFWRAAGFVVQAGNRADGAAVIVLPGVCVDKQEDQSFLFMEKWQWELKNIIKD
ncbi:MAG: hypothetical protein ACKN9T_18260 [Candidatus Methylumidiphilus sp.]